MPGVPVAPLHGRVALVTGGSRGIGAAVARRLAAAGAAVALTYVREAGRADAVVRDIAAAGGRALAIRADAADPGAPGAAVAETVAAYGRLDVLVNSAGIFETGPIGDLTAADFDRTTAVNLRAAFLAAKAAAPHMDGDGRIVLIGSTLARRTPDPGLSLYSMSKAGLVGLAKALARELGGRGITVNVVHPGSTDTDMNPATGPFAEPQRALMATGRFVEPDEVAALVTWLAGPDARSVTGAELLIDGGADA